MSFNSQLSFRIYIIHSPRLKFRNNLLKHLRIHEMNNTVKYVNDDIYEEEADEEFVVGDNHSEQHLIEQCPFCHIGFISQEALQSHLASDHPDEKMIDVDDGPNEDKFGCKSCDAQFANDVDLEAHVLTEHDTIVGKCEECDEEFTTQHQLDEHWLGHELMEN